MKKHSKSTDYKVHRALVIFGLVICGIAVAFVILFLLMHVIMECECPSCCTCHRRSRPQRRAHTTETEPRDIELAPAQHRRDLSPIERAPDLAVPVTSHLSDRKSQVGTGNLLHHLSPSLCRPHQKQVDIQPLAMCHAHSVSIRY